VSGVYAVAGIHRAAGGHGFPFGALLAFGAGTAVLLTLVLPEARAVKYLPPLALLAFLRPPAWGTVNLLVLMLGGFAWGRREPRTGTVAGGLFAVTAAGAPQIQPWRRARWTASCRLAAPSFEAAEER
jgi:hypothetical protein